MKVLVVDDEEDFLQLLTMRLRVRGLDVRCVTTGEDALESLAQQHAEVVVLDIRLPGMDGLQTLELIKERHPTSNVIMLTGYADPTMIQEVRARGVFALLMKPVLIGELLDTIRRAEQLARSP